MQVTMAGWFRNQSHNSFIEVIVVARLSSLSKMSQPHDIIVSSTEYVLCGIVSGTKENSGHLIEKFPKMSKTSKSSGSQTCTCLF